MRNTARWLKHIFLMVFGYALYLLTFKIFDLHLDNRFFRWALPYVGYQGYHPLKWWQINRGVRQ